ncbi:MAG: LPS assembly protein LptD [Pseudomonadota bacterium]
MKYNPCRACMLEPLSAVIAKPDSTVVSSHVKWPRVGAAGLWCALLMLLWPHDGPAQINLIEPDAPSQVPVQACQPLGVMPDRRDLMRSPDQPMDIRAQQFDATGRDQPIRFSDDVMLVYGDQRLNTDDLVYDPVTGEVELPGWLEYSDALFSMRATGARYNTRQSSGRFDQVQYRIAGAQGAGNAERIEMLNPEQARVQGFDFTTCDVNDPDWQLIAGDVDLDFEQGVGTARNAKLEFKGVPIFYSPWLSFPLNDQRKTGFLYPQLGSSSDNGIEVAVPWYWNIAPNMDATLTPRYIGNRGLMLGTEYRILTQNQGAVFNAEYLPDDDQDNRDRWLGRLDYRARLAQGWGARLNVNRVSDQDYFLDFGNELGDSVVQFLRSDLSVVGQGDYWTFRTTFDTFQVLDRSVTEANEPYSRLPRIELNGDWPLPANFSFGLDSEAVYFDRDNGVTGARVDVLPELSWRFLRPGWYLEPTLGLRTTAYALEDATGTTDNPSRVQSVFSFDAGMIFERQTASGRLQTLEPRLYYLYVPGNEQDDLPIFDTRELTFGFAQLFQTNRFAGADRQADANQMTLALTTRLLEDETGSSIVDASIGQILYFGTLDVQLPGRPADDRDTSATVAEINWRPSDRVLVNAGLQWDPDDGEADVAALGLRWQGTDSRQVQLGYRFRRDEVDQIDLRFRYPVSRTLNLVSRVNYSFEDSTALELLGGVEYESCCWAIRASVRRYVRDRESEKRTAFFVELHLKGLGSLGRRPYDLFTR